MKIDLRALGGCAVACAVVAATLAPAEETNWQKLNSADWGKAESGQAAGTAGADATQAQPNGGASGASGQGGAGAAIQAAFVDLGMEAPRAECYGKVLGEKLSPQAQQQAADLVRQSASADDVRTNVITGGTEMVGGFSAADAACPEGMGG